MSTIIDVIAPSTGESITSVFIGSWRRTVGQSIRVGEILVDIDSDKATLELAANHSGTIAELLYEEGDEVAPGNVIARIDTAAAPAAESAAAPAAAPEPAPAAGGDAKTGPASRQAAAELDIDIQSVSGSGRGGRILRTDVEAAAQSRAPAPAAAPTAAPAAPSVEALEERVRMSRPRQVIARRLVSAQQTAAILTTFNEVDLTNVKAVRKKYQELFVKKYGLKLGFMSFFVKAAIEALKEFPAVNAEIDGTDIVYKRYYNIGVAVSSPRGLMVPVIQNADRLSFAGIEQAIANLAGQARDGSISPAAFRNGTFTISNGGVFGSLMSTPILNPPQVGILGMHTIQERPVGINGQIVLRPMMYLALSYDHRIIDGREAVSFLVRIKQLVEDPERMLIEV